MAIVLAWSPAGAQEPDQDRIEERLDTIIANQRTMLERAAPDPLEGRRFGVELNLFRALLYDELKSLSGSVSLFPKSLHAEIAFPLFYGRSASDFSGARLTTWLADAHYRYFLGPTRRGFYLSGFTRFAHLSGTLEGRPASGTEDKLGVGVGIGYRIFSKRGPYWGTSFSLGRYIVGDNNIFQEDDFYSDPEIIVDVELFKFGWAF